MKRGKNDPGKISAKSDNWFKSYGQKVSYQRLGTGIEYPDPEPGNRDLIPVEPGNKKSGYLTPLVERAPDSKPKVLGFESRCRHMSRSLYLLSI